jgi:fermentation-respiration switch protein FrsA (DUF1100 family)
VSSTSLQTQLGQLGLKVLRMAALIYCVLLLVLLFVENRLLYPAPAYPNPNGDWNATYLPHEDIEFTSADGTKLHGWLVEHEQPRAVILYCHGNGDCLGYLGWYLKELRDKQRVTIFAFDYRGYAKSEGSPSEAGVIADGHAAQQWVAERMRMKPEEIVLMGRSLGGAVAVDLAATNGARGLILQNTATSIPDAAALIYWFAPVHWLMKNRYDSLSKIGRYQGPVLQSHGKRDTLVPIALGRKLFDAVPSTHKRFFVIDNGGHNDPEPPSYDVALDEFLGSLP